MKVFHQLEQRLLILCSICAKKNNNNRNYWETKINSSKTSYVWYDFLTENIQSQFFKNRLTISKIVTIDAEGSSAFGGGE